MVTTELDTLEKLQRIDHDTLIRLESKVDGLVTAMKDIREGTTQKLVSLEARIVDAEKIHEATNPIEAIKKLDEVYQWKHDFQLTYKILIGVASTIGGIIGFGASLLVKFVK